MHSRGIIILAAAWIFLLSETTLGESKVKRLQHSFEDGFDGWSVESASWERISLDDLKKEHPGKVPHPKEFNDTVKNGFVLIPSHNLNDSLLGIMKKDFVVKGQSVLEVYFSALALGWKDEELMFSSRNPLLEVIYDDVTVFQLDSAIRDNREYFSPDKWNQFRLFSSYTSGFNMTISILGKRGASSNLLALDNIIIKETPHKSSIDKSESEPETDVKERDGAWERLMSSMEKDMIKAASNHSIKFKPEFCDLNQEPGPCRQKYIRYYYNRTTKICESFTYGGCNGNDNNFNSKIACESICKNPSRSDDEELLKEKKKCHHLHLDFEEEFSGDKDGWTVRHFTRINYSNRSLNVTPNIKDSKFGISPDYESNTIFRRPTLLHPLDLIPDKELTINFSLLLVGDINMHIHPFFEHLNPGFKIYIGDYMIFDFLSAGSTDMQWHNYSVTERTNSILDSPVLTNFGHPEQILRIESWKGSALDESEVVILDDFSLVQKDPAPTTTLPPSVLEETSISTTTTIAAMTEHDDTTMAIVNDAEDSFPCDLPRDSGPCTGNLSRFYFELSSLECLPFTFGGCKGNANRFKSKEACLGLCSGDSPPSEDDPCGLPMDVGDIQCSSYSEKYFYDGSLGGCIIFLYSGCGGNSNRFNNNHECQEKCAISEEDSRTIAKKTFLKVADSTKYEQKIRRQDCYKGAEKGPCTGNYIAYAYDPLEEDCVRFVYGGCGGNRNRFYTIDKCRSTCNIPPKDEDNKCSDALKRRSTPGCIKRYFFDPKTSACISGCSGSKTKGFSSQDACMKECLHHYDPPHKDPCTLPLYAGSPLCNDSLPRYYFDSANGSCKEFTYSGCGASGGNVFPTKEICSSICIGVNPCFMPPVVGTANCEGAANNGLRFFYNFWKGSCEKLQYLGCGGNANNFPDEASCNETCQGKTMMAASTVVQREHSGMNTFTIVEIVLGVLVVVMFVLGGFLGWKYYSIQRNYGLFRNESTRSLRNSVAGTAIENPTYNISPVEGDNTFQLKPQEHDNINSSEA